MGQLKGVCTGCRKRAHVLLDDSPKTPMLVLSKPACKVKRSLMWSVQYIYIYICACARIVAATVPYHHEWLSATTPRVNVSSRTHGCQEDGVCRDCMYNVSCTGTLSGSACKLTLPIGATSDGVLTFQPEELVSGETYTLQASCGRQPFVVAYVASSTRV